MKKTTKFKLLTVGTAFSLFAGLAELPAQTVSWGSSWNPNSSLLLLSDGAAQGSTFNWQLGWFSAEPTAANATEWISLWNPIQNAGASTNPATFDNAGTTYYYAEGEAQISSSDPAIGKTAYIFGFNDLSLMGQAGGEAFILKSDLLINYTIGNADYVYIDSNIAEVLWGRIDRDIANAGGTTPGVGEFSVLAADNAFEVQAAGFAVVPEPASLVLTLCGLSAVAFRRRRQNA